ncbi:TrkA family potassium uptake protein [Gloeomargaritales cyanobacterium VI4D9]|nr:TrkA family potassium uptake protein [Gloeomargaritales cyanobacterium VI4D9]
MQAFWNRRRQHSHQFAVIGLGRFGRSVCRTLKSMGCEVLGVDKDEHLVACVSDEAVVDHAVELDSTDPGALKDAGLFEFETVIVAIGNYIQESVVTTLNLKEGNVAHIIAKASTDIHGRLLEKVGATKVVYPEKQMGEHLARSLVRPNIIERLELDPENSIVEVRVPEAFVGKSIVDLKLRNEYGVSVIALGRQGSHFEINPNPTAPLEAGMMMWVIGSNQALNKITDLGR